MSEENITLFPKEWSPMLYADAVINISTNGKKINQKKYLESGDFPVIDQGQDDIGGYTNDSEIVIECDFPAIIFGDHTRIVKYVKEPFAAGADGVKVLQPQKFIVPKLLEYFTRYLAISIKDKGYARHYQWMAKEHIGIPPENEQYRIVEKIEELFSELDNGIESLKTAREQLKVYRQVLLKHAFEGKLTARWREENKDKLETTDQLLTRIQKEREASYQQRLEEWDSAVKTWEEKDKLGKKPSKPPKHKVLPPIEDKEFSMLPELPTDWGYLRLAEIAQIGSGMSVSKDRKLEVPVEVPYLRVANVQRGRLILDEIKTMLIEESKLKHLALEKWDVLFNEGGDRDKLGRGWIWEGQIDPCITQNHVFRATTYLGGEFHSKYVSHWGNTFGQDYFEKGGKQTTNLASINKTVLSMFPVPLQSLGEQKIIIDLLDDAMSVIDSFEQEIISGLAKSEILRQSILKKAFSGQLVSQDSTDEPASELLKRIVAEKAKIAEQAKAARATAKETTRTAKSKLK